MRQRTTQLLISSRLCRLRVRFGTVLFEGPVLFTGTYDTGDLLIVPPEPGDANCDDFVDDKDASILGSNWQMSWRGMSGREVGPGRLQ